MCRICDARDVVALRGTSRRRMDRPGDNLANAIRQNVVDVVARLKSATPILSVAVADGKIKIVGGIYRLGDGRVELIG